MLHKHTHSTNTRGSTTETMSTLCTHIWYMHKQRGCALVPPYFACRWFGFRSLFSWLTKRYAAPLECWATHKFHFCLRACRMSIYSRFYYTSSWIVSIRYLMASNCCNLLRSARSYVQHLRFLRIFRSLQTQHRSIIWIGSFVRNTKCVVDSSSSWKIFSKQLQQRERLLIWRGQALYIKLTFNLITNGNDCYT
jgi:hypothetical protein